jgi:hypothetical protein
MFHLGYEMSFELWHLPYAAYLLWVAGLMAFFTLATTKDPMKILGQFHGNWLGMLCGAWMVSALLVAAFAWPLLIGGPFLIVGFGAPVTAGIIAGAYAFVGFYLSGRQIMAR